MSFVRNAATVFATAAVSTPIALATSVILARYLSGSDRGIYALATTFSLVVFVVTHLGWAEAAIYRMRRHRVAPSQAFSTGLAANSVLCAAALAICFVFERPITENFLGGMPRNLYWVAAATAVCLVLGDFVRALARGLDRFDLHNWFAFLQSVSLFAGLALVLVSWRGGIEGALYVNLIVQAALVVVFAGIVARATGAERSADLVEARAHLRFGLSLYPQAMLNHLHERIDVFILAWLAIDPAQIGLYAVAVSVIMPLQLIPGAVGTALLPELAGQSDESVPGYAAAVARQVSMQMTTAALGMVPLAIVGIPLLFGAGYRGSVLPALILLPGMTALSTGRVLGRYFAIVGRQRVITWVRIVAVASNIALNLLLVPRLGILGAALAALASYLAETAVIAAAFVSLSGLGFAGAFAWRRSDLSPYTVRLRALSARFGGGRSA